MSSATRMLRPYVRLHWPALFGSGAMAVVLALAELAAPWPLKIVLDHIILGHEGAFELGGEELTLLGAAAGLVLAIAFVSALGENLSKLWLQRAGERISHEMRTNVYDHLQRLSLRFHEQRQTGDLVTRVTGDANSVGDMFATSLGNLVQAGVLLVGMLVVTLVLDPVLALVWLAVVPFLGVTAFRFRAKIKATAKRQRAQEGAIASLANEALSAVAVVKVFGSERYERERVEERSEERMQIGMEASRLQAHFNSLIGLLSAFGTAAVVVLGVFRVAAGAITPGDLIVFASYARKVDSPLRHIAREAARIAKSMARAERIGEILAADEVLPEGPHAYAGPRARGEIVFENVSFGYTRAREALEGVTLRIPAGSRVALIGPSGAGKSTLGALAARLYDPTSGRVLLDGRDLRDCSLDWLRSQVGLLLQDTALFTGTVEDNIAYGAEVDPEAVSAAARAAAADDFVSLLPDGYGTELGPRGVGLSGGQRQRIGIARTLLRNPPILLLDEPTTALDAKAEAELLEGLERLMRGRTTILVTHSLDLARRADRVVVLEGGRIVAEGPPEEVLADRAGAERRGRFGRGRPSVPADPRLPQLNRLLEPEAMLPVLKRSLGRDTRVEGLRVARVLYKPGRRVAVHFRGLVDGEPHDAVASADTKGEAAAELPLHLDAARQVNGRSPARVPIAYDADVDALLTWLPFDAGLPALCEPPERLRDRLRVGGISVSARVDDIELLGYKPRTRAVFRLGDHVLKAYRKERQFRSALNGLIASSGFRSVEAPRYEACCPELRLTVQPAVDGSLPETPTEVAREAGALVRRLQRERVNPPRAAGPAAFLHEAERRTALVRAVVPELRAKLDQVLARLRRELPPEEDLLPAHGDFHVNQLLRVGGRLVVVDFDGMCLAPRAVDLATFLADVVRGRGRDLATIENVAEPLLVGYGRRPPALDWYLAAMILTRAPHPFHRLVPGWPDRVAETVAVAEEVLAR